jgi:sulfide:quinone oxidoreductase
MTRRLRLVVVGAGVAGLEALVALHALAPGRIDATLLEPRPTFRLRALDVGEPFGLGRARRYPVAGLARLAGRARALAAELGAVRREASPWVEPRGRATMV